jgi:hypothetical protein
MYTTRNFKTKKELKDAVTDYLICKGAREALERDPDDSYSREVAARNAPPVKLFAPGLGTPEENGEENVEGPHFPQPHKWYAQVVVENGIVVKVK